MPELAPVRKTFMIGMLRYAVLPATKHKADVCAAEPTRIAQRDARSIRNRFRNNRNNGALRIQFGNVCRDGRELLLQRQYTERRLHCARQRKPMASQALGAAHMRRMTVVEDRADGAAFAHVARGR